MKRSFVIALFSMALMTGSGYGALFSNGGSCSSLPPRYDNRVLFFTPFHLGYERIKPCALYVGVEGFLADVKDDNTLVNAEYRMGYNFCIGRNHFTPMIGAGYLKVLKRQRSTTFDQLGMIYETLGFHFDRELNSRWNLGLNAKFLVGETTERRDQWGTRIVGSDVALPITLRLGECRKWDVRARPFDIYVHGKKKDENYFGATFSVGYRF